MHFHSCMGSLCLPCSLFFSLWIKCLNQKSHWTSFEKFSKVKRCRNELFPGEVNKMMMMMKSGYYPIIRIHWATTTTYCSKERKKINASNNKCIGLHSGKLFFSNFTHIGAASFSKNHQQNGNVYFCSRKIQKPVESLLPYNFTRGNKNEKRASNKKHNSRASLVVLGFPPGYRMNYDYAPFFLPPRKNALSYSLNFINIMWNYNILVLSSLDILYMIRCVNLRHECIWCIFSEKVEVNDWQAKRKWKVDAPKWWDESGNPFRTKKCRHFLRVHPLISAAQVTFSLALLNSARQLHIF